MTAEPRQVLRTWFDRLRTGWLGALYRNVVPFALRRRLQHQRMERKRLRYAFPRSAAWSPAPDTPNDRAAPPVVGCGVNVVGFLRAQFGLGESARNYARALYAAGVPVSLFDIDLGLPHTRGDRSLNEQMGQALAHPVSLVFVNPDYLDKALLEITDKCQLLGYVIGCWFWELERLPKSWLPALQHVDEVMVSSGFIEKAVRQVTDKPVFRVPMPLGTLQDSGLHRADFGIDPRAFVFLFTFDFASWVERKNPLAVVRAFRRAFPANRHDVRLVLKSSNGHRLPDWMRQVESMIGGDPRIMLRDEVIEKKHLIALQRCADAYVSLHRAEGFGLGMAECMAQGKPVIATGWSGNLEFMDAQCAALVGYTLVPVPAGAYLDTDDQRWAEPDEEDAARWMRRLADDRDFARELGERGRRRVQESLSVDAAARQLRARLRQIEERGKVPAGSQSECAAARRGAK